MSWMAVRHGIAAHLLQSDQTDRWQRAATIEPDNPENSYRLGRYYQIDFEHADMSRAIANYARAATIAPGTAEYWLDLAEVQETAQHVEEAEKDFRRAQQAYPLSANVAWRFGNFLLRQNRQEQAYQEIHRALSVQPSLTALAISRCWQSSRDIEKILQLTLPANPEAYWGAIDFLVDAREPDAAMVVWKHLMASKPNFALERPFRLEDMLIDAGHPEDARTVWQQSLAVAGGPGDSQKSGLLVWNGGFEQEVSNGGMGWRFQTVPGAELSFDPRVAHSQARSLRVAFDGTGNVDFQQPWQYVLLQPNTRYRLSAYFRTENLTTSSPIRLELEETHFGNAVEAMADLPENQSWASSEVEFTTGTGAKLFRLVLRRRSSPKLDNKIAGTIWMDDISLTPVVESSALQ
jgi:tetratricopeptide (TPR) repeat protein